MSNNLDQEGDILSPEELCIQTKDTLKSWIKTTSMLTLATALTGVSTIYVASKIEDKTTKNLVLTIGGIGTGIEAIIAGTMFTRLNSCIDAYDDAIKLSIIHQFLNAKSEDEKEELIDKIIDELHAKTQNNQ